VVFQRTNEAPNPLTLSADEVAEARIYLGSESLALGLIDGEGSRTDAIEKAAELAGLATWQTVDLETWLNMPAPEIAYLGLAEAVERMVVQAPPNSLYMLDDRIALPGIVTRDDLMRHLASLRPDASRSFMPNALSTSALPDWVGGE
jgi:ClpP class serine protease